MNKRAKRMLAKAREYTIGTYVRKFVAPVFQRMIRAEAAAQPDGWAVAVVRGELCEIRRRVGECICVTCGAVGPWTGTLLNQGMQCGHFISRAVHSTIFSEDPPNTAPQCYSCNKWGYGRRDEFRRWLVFTQGSHAVERLEQMKNENRSFTREELIDLRIGYSARLRAAQSAIEGKS